VIFFELGNETKIYSNGDCVVLEAKNGEDLRKITTKLAYNLLGIF
jgi:hypothetical protein